MLKVDLEHDLTRNVDVCTKLQQSPELAHALYAALCNNQFRHASMSVDHESWSCTWRYAGGLVAGLVDPTHQDYLDYYCNGNEGYVSPEIETMLHEMGWSVLPCPMILD